jgi:FkbM family methyltransferase
MTPAFVKGLIYRAILMDHAYVRRAMNASQRSPVAAAWLRLRARIGAAVFRMPSLPMSDSPNLWIAGLLGPGDTYYDVGANAGETLSIAAARVGRSGSAHAFEPNPPMFASLSNLVRLAGWRNVRISQVALAEEEGETELFCPPSSSSSTISRNFISHIPDASLSSVKCPLITLDSYWAGTGRAPVTLMKLDIEGAELLALRGGTGLIEGTRPYLVMEVTDSAAREAAFGYRTRDLLQFLTSRGYDLFHMAGGRAYPLPSHDDLPDSIHDVCAIPKERLASNEVRRLFAARRPR